MTQNAKMRAPKEMATERLGSAKPMADSARARKRMDSIVAPPEEIDLYCYAPNAARGNLRPGIPCHDEYPSYED